MGALKLIDLISGGLRNELPFRDRPEAMHMKVDGRAAGRAGWNEVVAQRGKDADETLQPTPRPEPLHRSLSFSQRDMGIFGAIIQTFMRAMLDFRHEFSASCGIGGELVGDYALRAAALLM